MKMRISKEKKPESVHFIGAGGIGVSALAKYFMSRGARVTGSDIAKSEITDELRRLGARIKIGPHKARNISPGTTRVIYTAAVQKENPE